MTSPNDVDDAPTDAMPPARHAKRPALPRFLRTFAVPIVLIWIVLIAILNGTVPQLEEVGKLRAVSMSPNDAPSLIATKRVGHVFGEYDTSSNVMIVLEGQQPLGAEAHAFYDEMVRKLRADATHVQHVQDFWGDTLTAAGAQSIDGKAAYVQVYVSGDQGEAIANESVDAVREIVDNTPAPVGVRAYVT
jgi:RND superfamily putative drug exporter